MYINEMMMPMGMEKQPCPQEVVDPDEATEMCYDCRMQNLGLTLLKAIKSHFPSEHTDVKPESIKDGETAEPYELIELMMYQAQQRDKMNRDLMEEVASLREEKTRLMAEVNHGLNLIVNFKRDLALLHNEIGKCQATRILERALQN